jgi:hypothetical protein
MKVCMKIVFLLFSFGTTCFAQRDTIFLDSSTGNYVVRYIGHFRSIVGPKGMRPYNMDQPLLPEERIVRRDSIISVVLEPATKIIPAVACKVVKERRSEYYVYSYRITNQLGSIQPLNEFGVDFNRSVDIFDATPTDGWHSLRGNDVQGNEVVPGHTWHWFGDIGLEQGNSWVVGALRTRGLPGIVNSYFAGKTVSPSFPGGGPSIEVDAKVTQLLGFPSNYLVFKTVGPMRNVEFRVPHTFLDTLLSYVHKSHELGWINNTRDDDCEADERAEDGIVKNLDKRLIITKDLIAKDKIGAAKARLQMFLNKVERLWSRQEKEEARNRKNPRIIFTSEAYALLKYNGEYLLDHLVENKKDKDRDERTGKEK